MAFIERKRALSLLVLLTLCFAHIVWADSKRDLKRETARNCTADRLIESAQRWMGVRELTGHNDHPMITKALKVCGLAGNKGYAWCAASMAEIHDYAALPAPHSARVPDWFKHNVVWKREWGKLPHRLAKRGMVGGLYYNRLGRYGHIVLIEGESKDRFYLVEGNTNLKGSNEGDGFYRTTRRKESIAVLADYCLNGQQFINEYDNYLQQILKQQTDE